ncbi:E3 SUMO-protein ligase ZBED1-like [Nothobranchius furzeri]|uniref:E3 SUMO-protein ligase ZBED1-like n=1 Tax=Nothobranchius furzeri TaxID=105023 RepID=UPI003904AE8E
MERRMQLRTGAFAVMAELSSELALQIKDPPKTLKADIWSRFGFYQQSGRHDLDMSYAVCKTCHSKIKYVGNTTNLRNHVSRFHPELLTITPAVEPPSPAQPKINAALSIIPPNSEKGKKITQAVGAFIAKDLRPYSVVENPGFKHMLKTLEPRYKVPARSHFAEQVIPALYDETKAKILTSMSKANLVAITCDSWTSVATESYITVTAHYMSEDWQIISLVLQTRAVYESHTGAHLAELLSDVVSEWQLSDKDIVLVTDNASNMILAAQIRKFKHVRCFAHTLNLASQRGLRVASLTRLLGRIRRISIFFQRSTTASHCLKVNQKCLGLKNQKLLTDVPTRWNSSYDMVQRFLEQQPAICATLLSPEVRKGESDICTLNETDVSNAEDAVSALKAMKDATTLISEESNPTISLIAPLKAQLLQNMTSSISDSPMIHDIKNAVRTDLMNRYSSEAEKKMLCTASALDPRFKGLPFLTEKERSDVYREVTEEATCLEQECILAMHPKVPVQPEVQKDGTSADDPSAAKRKPTSLLVSLLGQSFNDVEVSEESKTPYVRAEEEMDNYLKTSSLPLSEDPLNWWRVHKVTFPLLARLSKRYLCIPGTSVSAERVFSTAGDVITAKRSTLKPQHHTAEENVRVRQPMCALGSLSARSVSDSCSLGSGPITIQKLMAVCL